jgi:hypothetical protein
MKYKTVGYAYPTSPTATRHGYGKTGCYYVATGKQPDSDVAQKIEGVWPDEASALEYARRVQLPWSPIYAQFHPEAA